MTYPLHVFQIMECDGSSLAVLEDGGGGEAAGEEEEEEEVHREEQGHTSSITQPLAARLNKLTCDTG